MRDYRKGNWTVSETMILIEAKKMDEERRLMKRISSTSSNIDDQSGRGKPAAELRWKWVEDYCWRKGCMRSQNQCNDKWDNLMRDYKKVRDYERKVVVEGSSSSVSSSYWNIGKNERKERILPTNMLPQIYEALFEVMEKKSQVQSVNVMALTTTTTSSSVLAVPSSSSSPNVLSYAHHQLPHPVPTPLMPPPLMLQHHMLSAPPISVAAALPLPSPHIAAAPKLLPPTQTQPLALPHSHPLPTMCDSSDSDTSEHSKSPAKRRRRGSGGGEGTSAAGTASAATARPTTTTTSDHQVGSAISKSASIIAEALEACEEREDIRHRDVLSLHERRIKIEESKAEINKLGFNGLVDAVNNLANSIQALASQNSNNQSAPK